MTITSLMLVALAATAVAAGPAIEWTIDIGTRSYDGTWWFCADGVDRPIPDKYATEASRAGATFDELKNERPAMRQRGDVTEPDILDDGNSWVAFVNGDQRIAYLVSSNGYHPAVCTKTMRVNEVENINGQDYIEEMAFKTKPLTREQLDEIAAKVGAGKKINQPYKKPNYLYKGTDFVIELILEVTDAATQEKYGLRKSANNWPPHFHLFDAHYKDLYGQSAFENNQIPFGNTPPRDAMETMRNIKDTANKPRN